MRSVSRFPVLALFGLLGMFGCGGEPDALNPSLATGPTPPPIPTLTATPTTVSLAPGTSTQATFVAKNNTATTIDVGWGFWLTGGGAVTSIGAPNPTTLPKLAPGGSKTVLVPYTVGSSGSGTLVLHAERDAPAGTANPATLTVTVSGTCGIVTDTQNKSIAALNKPGYLQSVTDPAFHTKITRITGDPAVSIPNIPSGTWGDTARHRYSKEAAWNADQSLIVLKRIYTDPTSHLFLDGSTYQVQFAGSPPPHARESETRWHPTLPDIMIYVTDNNPLIVGHWNVRGGYAAKVTASGYTNGYFGPYEGNSSRDGRYMVVFATRVSDQKAVAFAVDLTTGQKFADIVIPSDLGVSTDAGWASISASGNYVVLMGDKLPSPPGQTHISRVYTRDNGTFVKELPGLFKHYDLTLDAAGADIGVGMKTGSGIYKFSTIGLTDAVVKPLGPLTLTTSNTHSSARNLGRPGWAYMTVNDGPDPFQKEIFALKLDGSGAVERLAHHRSNVTVYNTEPHAVPSPDGKRVIFASNWGAATAPIHTFVVDVRPICP